MMVNINKDTIKKIKEIDVKSDAVFTDAEKKAENIILESKHKTQAEIKEAKDSRDMKKASAVETSKKENDEKGKALIEKGISKFSEKKEKTEQKTFTAADVVVELFIKKIEKRGQTSV